MFSPCIFLVVLFHPHPRKLIMFAFSFSSHIFVTILCSDGIREMTGGLRVKKKKWEKQPKYPGVVNTVKTSHISTHILIKNLDNDNENECEGKVEGLCKPSMQRYGEKINYTFVFISITISEEFENVRMSMFGSFYDVVSMPWLLFRSKVYSPPGGMREIVGEYFSGMSFDLFRSKDVFDMIFTTNLISSCVLHSQN